MSYWSYFLIQKNIIFHLSLPLLPISLYIITRKAILQCQDVQCYKPKQFRTNCSICFGLVENPKVLPCEHAFCGNRRPRVSDRPGQPREALSLGVGGMVCGGPTLWPGIRNNLGTRLVRAVDRAGLTGGSCVRSPHARSQ